MEDNRNDVAGDVFPVDLVVGVDPGSEDQPDARPFQRALAETERFECLQFGGVELETGFAGDRVGGFSDPVQPDARVDTAGHGVCRPAAGREGLGQLIERAACCVCFVGAPGLDFDGGNMDPALAGI